MIKAMKDMETEMKDMPVEMVKNIYVKLFKRIIRSLEGAAV